MPRIRTNIILSSPGVWFRIQTVIIYSVFFFFFMYGILRIFCSSTRNDQTHIARWRLRVGLSSVSLFPSFAFNNISSMKCGAFKSIVKKNCVWTASRIMSKRVARKKKQLNLPGNAYKMMAQFYGLKVRHRLTSAAAAIFDLLAKHFIYSF